MGWLTSKKKTEKCLVIVKYVILFRVILIVLDK